MRMLKRNERKFYYCLYSSKSPVQVDGVNTSDSKVTYETATEYYGNISTSHGTAESMPFGTFLDYDKVIVVEDASCPITETTVLFVDKAPEYDSAGNPLYDYVVRRVSRSLSSGTAYAIIKVR